MKKIFGDKIYTDKILKIKENILIPNFYLNYYNNIFSKEMMEQELNQLISKIFFTEKNPNLTFYETEQFFIDKDDIVFDCGGNMGLFAAAVANRCKQVYTFEPMSLIRKNLHEVAKLYSNITIIPKGLWKFSCVRELLQKDNPGASTAVYYTNKYNKTLYKEKCSLITIDNFIKDTGIIPTFIKVDIENSEIQLLEGAQQCLQKYGPKISIVLHFNDSEQIEYIKQLLPNYKVTILSKRGNELIILGEKDED